MIVQKVLNNSLVLSMDDDNREVIVMGKGIGFNSRPGDAIAPEKIEKLFVTQALGARSGYLEALSAIPDEVIEMAAMIISAPICSSPAKSASRFSLPSPTI